MKDPEMKVVKGKPPFMIQVRDSGPETFNVEINLQEGEEAGDKMVDAAARTMVAVAVTLAKAGYGCGHIGCIFNQLIGDMIAELRQEHPTELARAKFMASMAGIVDAEPVKGPGEDDKVH